MWRSVERYQDSPVESSEEGGFNALWFWPDSSGREAATAVEPKADEQKAVERRARPGDCPAFSWRAGSAVETDATEPALAGPSRMAAGGSDPDDPTVAVASGATVPGHQPVARSPDRRRA